MFTFYARKQKSSQNTDVTSILHHFDVKWAGPVTLHDKCVKLVHKTQSCMLLLPHVILLMWQYYRFINRSIQSADMMSISRVFHKSTEQTLFFFTDTVNQEKQCWKYNMNISQLELSVKLICGHTSVQQHHCLYMSVSLAIDCIFGPGQPSYLHFWI